MKLKLRDKLGLRIQHLAGWMTFPFWGTTIIGLLHLVGRYKVSEMREIRRHFRRLQKSTEGPILVCSNHLTKIDSVILNWSLASVWSYMRSFKIFSWNLPERANFYHNYFTRSLCYLASCIPIDRGGSREAVKRSLDKATYLLKKGHTVTIFPEGGRSRSGRLNKEQFTYGVGQLVKKVKDCNVLCVYLRGHNQHSYSNIPHRGARFHISMEIIKPDSVHSGLRATRDVAQQIFDQLTQMEQAYFASAGQ